MKTLVRAIIQIPVKGYDEKKEVGTLILLQPPNPQYPQFGYTYQLPGGAVDDNDKKFLVESDEGKEDLIEPTAVGRIALRRELEEELNIKISTKPEDLIPLFSTVSPQSGNKHVTFLVKKIDKGSLKILDLHENVGLGIYTPKTNVPPDLMMPGVRSLQEDFLKKEEFTQYAGLPTEGIQIPPEYLHMSTLTPEGVIDWETQQSKWMEWEAETRIKREGTIDIR